MSEKTGDSRRNIDGQRHCATGSIGFQVMFRSSPVSMKPREDGRRLFKADLKELRCESF